MTGREAKHSDRPRPVGAGSFPPGTSFGRYRIERLLGEGGMGTVYLARDETLHRPVALKIPKFEPGDSATHARFLREAEVAGGLRHANICPVFDVGEFDGLPFLTMAFIDGKELSAWCQPGKLMSPRQAAALVRKLALALETAHAAGIVHRDLKPENVMIDKSGTPIIMDFGLARAHDEANQVRLTQQGVILGSPTYMSPEQAEGRPERIGPATDIYSLGVVFYEMLTGTVPFKGSVAAVISRLLTKAPPRPRDVRPDLDPGLETICLRMMAKKIHERYATMSDVAAVLGAWLEKQRPESGQVRAAAGDGPPESPPTPSSAAPAPVRAASEDDASESRDEAKEKESGGILVKAIAGVFVTVIAPVAVAFGIKYADVVIASIKARFETHAADSKDKKDEPAKDAADKKVSGKDESGGLTDKPADEKPRKIATFNEPAFRQWMKEVAALPPDEQVEAVGKKLKELNPGFDGSMSGTRRPRNKSKNPPKIEGGAVTEISFVIEDVADISPVRALAGLKSLTLLARPNYKSQLSDLSPLRGMPLTSLVCNWTQVADLSPLHECPNLSYLNVKQTRVTATEVATLQKALPDCKIDCDELARPVPAVKP